MKLSRNLFAGIALCVAPALSTSVFATAFDFDVTYDGASAAWDGTGDNPIGSILAAGDTFNYNYHAAGDDYWNIDVGSEFFPFLAFTIAESGNRTGNLTMSLYLDGVQQGSSLVDNGIVNSFIHLGTNAVNLAAGLMFDEVVLDYALISSFDGPTPVASTITNVTLTPGGSGRIGGFGENDISYVSAVSVPLPATAWLFVTVLGGLMVTRRKQLTA